LVVGTGEWGDAHGPTLVGRIRPWMRITCEFDENIRARPPHGGAGDGVDRRDARWSRLTSQGAAGVGRGGGAAGGAIGAGSGDALGGDGLLIGLRKRKDSGWSGGKVDDEGDPRTSGPLCEDRAPVGRDDGTDDRQPQSGPAVGP